METKKPSVTKSHRICFVLSQSRDPMVKETVMRAVHSLEGKDPAAFRPTVNTCYWSPSGKAAGGRSSVLFRGLVTKNGRIGRRTAYTLTPAGHAHALEYIASKA